MQLPKTREGANGLLSCIAIPTPTFCSLSYHTNIIIMHDQICPQSRAVEVPKKRLVKRLLLQTPMQQRLQGDRPCSCGRFEMQLTSVRPSVQNLSALKNQKYLHTAQIFSQNLENFPPKMYLTHRSGLKRAKLRALSQLFQHLDPQLQTTVNQISSNIYILKGQLYR